MLPFRTDPDPFGSVFRFDFPAPEPFVFAHMIHSSSICVSLGDVGYVVFILDGQALKRDRAMGGRYAEIPKLWRGDMLFFYAQCIEHLARHRLGQDIVMAAGTPGSPGFIARLGRTVVHDVQPPDKGRFRLICETLGIEWIDTEPWTP